MKKILIFVSLILLVGCSSNNEIKSFTEKYNENAYEFVSVELLDEKEFGEIRKEKYGTWKNLQQFENRYTFEAKYDDDENLTGYYMSISGEHAYENYEGEGYEASLVIVETLGLDRKKFEETYKNTIETDTKETTYTDDEYEVSLLEFNVADPHDGMIINFDKK